MDYILVLSIQHLKELSSINGVAEFYLILAGGLCRSGKQIHFDNKTEKIDIYNEIDGVWQNNLCEEQLYSETNIVDAINNSSFYYVGCQLVVSLFVCMVE